MFRYLFLHLLSGWEEWSWAALTSFRQCFWMSSYSFENPMSLSTCNDAWNFQKVVLLKSSSLNECRLVCQQRFLPFKTTRRFRIPHLCWIDALGMILIHYLEPLVWYFATAYCEDLFQDIFFLLKWTTNRGCLLLIISHLPHGQQIRPTGWPPCLHQAQAPPPSLGVLSYFQTSSFGARRDSSMRPWSIVCNVWKNTCKKCLVLNFSSFVLQVKI